MDTKREEKSSQSLAPPQVDRLLAALLDSPTILFEQDTDLRFTWVYNYDLADVPNAEPILGKRDADLVPDEDAQRLTQIKQQVLNSGIATHQEVPVTLNGAIRYFDLIVKPRYEVDGTISGISGVATDITKHKQLEAQYQMLFDRNPNPMWICDLATLEFLEVNDAALSLYGYSRSEFLAMKVLDLQAPENRTEVLQAVSKQRTNTDYSHACESRHRKQDGTIIDVEINSHALTWLGRSARCVLAKDISDRKSAEDAQQRLNAKLETKVMQRTSELQAVNQQLMTEIIENQRTTDTLNLQIERLNKMYSLVAAFNQATDLNEIYEVAIVGITDLLKTTRGAIMMPDPSGIPRYKASVGISESYKRAVEDYLTSSSNRQETGTVVIANLADILGDELLDTMRGHQGIKAVASFPIKYQERQLGKIIIYYDIPHQFDDEEMQLAQTIANYLSVSITRKQAELALLASESRFRTIVDNLPGTIYRCLADEQWTTLFISDSVESITGHPSNSFKCRRDCIQHVIPEDQEKFTQIVESAIAARQPFELEYRVIHADGNIKWLYEKGQGFWDNYGNLLYLDGAIFDISDRKASELRLQQSLHEKEVLLKEIHHRVKNNLQIVFGLLELQARSIHDPYIKTLFAESQNRIHSMALIHEMLYRSSDLSQIDFATYLQDLLHSLAQSYNVDAQRISFQIDIETFPLNIELATPCGLIVNELITNALKHAFPDRRSGNIGLTCHKNKENRVCLTISDNGIGVPADINISKTRSLGLQLVYTLTKQLKGNIILR
ncbi:MAG: PAS domain S-box protein [Pseudanabaena sp. CRU_2_10]|nr:PAS domain S-box protein [Pseudanabaena sp. CRU_2_10]